MGVTRYFESFLKKENSYPGVRQRFWFWATEAFLSSPNSEATPAPHQDDSIAVGDAAPADEQVTKILTENPTISAPGLVNAMKANGLAVVDQKGAIPSNEKTEADSLSTQPQLARAGAKAPQKQSAIKDKFIRCRFLESKTIRDGVGPTVFKVALIQEGLGNLRDAFYYTRDSLESAITQFEGKKCYADHPSREDEVNRPERSVRDIVGHYEDVQIQDADDGSAMLVANLVMLPDPSFEWARSLVRHAVDYGQKYPDKEFIGLSINASGDAVEMSIQDFLKEAKIPDSAKPKLMDAINQGLDRVRVVSAIEDAVSTDLVTEPGAKGKVIEMLEGEIEKGIQMATKTKKETIKLFEDDKKQPPVPPKKEGADDPKPGDQPGGDDHSDADQDKKLILDMIKKHMGDQGGDDGSKDGGKSAEGDDKQEGHKEGEMGEDAEAAAHQAYEAYKEMGYEHEDAIKCAAHSMKLAKHMASKHEAEKKEGGEPANPPHSDDKKPPTSLPNQKEAEATIVKLEGRIAMLERERNERTLADTLDKKLRESGLARAETDKIRTLIGTPKSEKEIVEKINLFKEGMQQAGSKSSQPNPFITNPEKTPTTGSKGSFDLTSGLIK